MMTRKMADALASVLMGQVEYPDLGTHGFSVSVQRADGKFVWIDEDGAVLYENENHCRVGDDPSEACDTFVWDEWDGCHDWARGLADVLGGGAYHTGGGICVAFFTRADGRCAVIGEEIVAVYDRWEDFLNDDDGIDNWVSLF